MKHIKNFNQLKLESNFVGGVPSKTDFVMPEPITTRDTFATGKSDILVASEGFKEITGAMKNLPEGTKIIVTGGASRVGEDKGFDNLGLAKKRAQNMIAKLKEAYPKFNYSEGTHTIGTTEDSKVKDSDQAKKDQFVRVEFKKGGKDAKSTSAIDNTGVDNSNVKKDHQGDLSLVTLERWFRVVFPGGMNQAEAEEESKKIKSAIGAMGKGYKVGAGPIKVTQPKK